MKYQTDFLPLRNYCTCLAVYFICVFHFSKFEALTAVLLKIQVFRDIMSYRLIDLYRSFD
jgi:hypothetical protein